MRLVERIGAALLCLLGVNGAEPTELQPHALRIALHAQVEAAIVGV